MFIYYHLKPFLYIFVGAFIGVLLFAGVVYQSTMQQESSDLTPTDTANGTNSELTTLNFPDDRGEVWQEFDIPISTVAGEEYTDKFKVVLMSTEDVGLRLRDEVLPTMRDIQETVSAGNFIGIYGKIKDARALIASVRLDTDQATVSVNDFTDYNSSVEGLYSEDIQARTSSLLNESKALLNDIDLILNSLDGVLTGVTPTQAELNAIDELGVSIETRSANLSRELDELLVLLLDL
ncbi:hypothetical protein CL653_03150 [bacterium]|nr:hypothetical protein [bacterium]|tara:strand:- start:515 stop:1222 length:708 start_codon:yes stop_codon:yes gene_type:complete